jgi:hypothetical protein
MCLRSWVFGECEEEVGAALVVVGDEKQQGVVFVCFGAVGVVREGACLEIALD